MKFVQVERPSALTELFLLYPNAVQTALNGEKYVEFTEPFNNGKGEFWGRVWGDGEVSGNNVHNQCTPFSIARRSESPHR